MSQSSGLSDTTLTRSDRVTINILIFGVILPLLDATLVNVALHDIGVQLSASMSLMQWVVTAYTLAAASAVPLSAWLAGKVGPKNLWIACLCLFLVGSCLSAMAGSVTVLVFSRVLQGVATGLLLPTMQTIVVVAIGREKSRAALSAMSIPSVLAPILGPVIGGLVLQFLNWRWIFWLNIPICITAIIIAVKGLPGEKIKAITPLDLMGFVLLSPGLVFFVYGLSGIGEGADKWPFFILAGLVLMTIFVWRAVRLKDAALVDVSIFGEPDFRSSCALLFLSSIVYYGGILLFPLYLIQYGGYGLSLAGFLLALHGAGAMVARQKLPAISRRWGDRRTAYAAIALAVLGSLLLFPPEFLSDKYIIAAAMIIRGAGVGVLTILSMSSAYQKLAPEQVAHASSLSRIVTHLGATIGAALIAVFAMSSESVQEGFDVGYANAQVALLAVIVMCGLAAWRLSSHSVKH